MIVPRSVGPLQHPIFMVTSHDKVIVMDPAEFRQWMADQTWPLDAKNPQPRVLLPGANEFDWTTVRFEGGPVKGGRLVIATASDSVLYDTEGAVISVIYTDRDTNPQA